MAFGSIQADTLKLDIKKFGDSLSQVQSNPSRIGGLKNTGSVMGGTGISANVVNHAKKTDIFTAAAGADNNTTKASQNNNTQNSMSNSTSEFSAIIVAVANKAANALTNAINALQAKIDSLDSDASAMSTPKATGQSVTPKDNMPTDNQGSENKSANPQDSQKPNVGFGEETVSDKAEAKADKDPSKVQQESKTSEAQTSSELDKATQKEVEKQQDKAQQQLQQEWARLSQATAS